MKLFSPRLDLDLVAKPAAWSLQGLLVLVLGLAFAAGVLMQQQRTQTAYDEVDQALSKLTMQNQQDYKPVVKTDDTATRDAALEAQWITDQLAYPWQPLFEALEKTKQPDVALLSLQPDTKKMQVKIGGEAKDFKTVLAYIDQLQALAVFSKIYLIKHEVNEADKQKPIDFTLIAYWQNQHE